MKKSLFKIFAVALMGIGTVSCIGGAGKDAAALYSESEAQIACGNFAEAIEILDTLNARYPDQLAIRRNALGLRARAMEGLAMDSIAIADADLAAATIAEDSLKTRFRHIAAPAPGMDGYWLPVGVSDRAMASTGIQARVNDDGYLYVVASLNGRRIHLHSIELKEGGESVRSGSISAARLITLGQSETASFNQEEVADFGPWLKAHPRANKIVFVGASKTAQANFTAAMRDELLLCYDYAMAIQARRLASIRREKYERMLAASRDQIANYSQYQE